MTNKTIKKKRTEEGKEDQKIPLTKEEKRNRAIFLALPKYSKIKEMILANELTMKDIEIAIPAICLGAGFDRKQVANLFSLTIGFESHLREVRKICREQIKRLKTRLKFSANQRRYFENRMIYGLNKEREDIAIATELMNILKNYSENQVVKLEYLTAGVDLAKIARSVQDNKQNYKSICQKIMDGLQRDNQIEIMGRFKGIYDKAEINIKNVEDLAIVIARGYRRPYLKKKGNKHQ